MTLDKHTRKSHPSRYKYELIGVMQGFFKKKIITIIAVLCLVTQSCPTLSNPMDCVAFQVPLSKGIIQARILKCSVF